MTIHKKFAPTFMPLCAALVFFCCLCITLPAGAQSFVDICFRHKTRDTIIIKRCVKMKGKHDAFFTYECPDEKSGQMKAFDPKDKWEELDKDAPGCRKILWNDEVPEIPEPPPVPRKMESQPMKGFEK